MVTVLIVIHLMIVVALVAVVLLQRSEGGALGIGGGGGFFTGRGAANALTRTTAVLAAAFFATSLVLAVLAGHGRTTSRSIFDAAPATGQGGGTAAPGAPASDPTRGSGQGVLPALRGQQAEPPAQAPAGPQVPQSR
jgi:preprotein translocase subunit SecG